ncbi:MAG: EAL domain-containing protein [Lachnospiraceae bacterium]|nr:EAL domain-containing protein [Lachnospiraceae bacterium]
MTDNILFLNYSPIGDVITIILCIFCFMLHTSSYAVRDNRLIRFRLCMALVFVATLCSIGFHTAMVGSFTIPLVAAYVMHCIMNLCMIGVLLIVCLYLRDLCITDPKLSTFLTNCLWTVYAVYVAFEITSQYTKIGLFIEDGMVHQSVVINPFNFAYYIYALVMFFIVFFNKKRLITRMRQCLISIIILAYGVVIVEVFYDQLSYTAFTFFVPVLAALYLFHYNSYDLDTGTLNLKSLVAYVSEAGKNKPGVMYLDIVNVPAEARKQYQQILYHFGERFFKAPTTFRMADNKIVLCYEKSKNPDDENRIKQMLESFNEIYNIWKIDYKVIAIKDLTPEFTGDTLINFLEEIDSQMQWNTIKHVNNVDIDRYNNQCVVLEALKDIADKRDLNDERVRVYCQPVYNTKTGAFTTAEALMRLVLPDRGMIYPDIFIPLAEKNDYIHELTKIILNKTCIMINELVREGFVLDRISVNVSTGELKATNFCDEVISIIEGTGAPMGKVAIEITESRNENDYDYAKDAMIRLKDRGIYFYLDDFGTGYSNMERLVNLPFDVIKFDRSMTILSGKNAESMYLVTALSNIFHYSGYTILFEGVEDDNDEQRCAEMNGFYLQGYKYSKPIPIEDLKKFLAKNEIAK